jgi:hypothetical protein
MKTASFIRSNLLPCLGLVLPPLLWAINTQLGQVLPYAECGSRLKLAAITSLTAAVLSLAAGFLSWRTTIQNKSDSTSQVTAYPASFGFVGLLSGLAGATFAFTLLLQGLSSLVLTGCER